MLSLQFALDYPDRVRRLVLADTMSGVWTQKFRRFIDHAKQYSDVWFATREEIARAWLAMHP